MSDRDEDIGPLHDAHVRRWAIERDNAMRRRRDFGYIHPGTEHFFVEMDAARHIKQAEYDASRADLEKLWDETRRAAPFRPRERKRDLLIEPLPNVPLCVRCGVPRGTAGCDHGGVTFGKR